MSATKAIWVVTAGRIHGEPLFETRFWLDSQKWEEDPVESFATSQKEALYEFQRMSEPERGMNWVHLEYVWT